MHHIHSKTFRDFLCLINQTRFLSNSVKTFSKNRQSTHDKGNSPASRLKKDKGPSIPLPDITGEVLWGIHPVQAALSVGKRHVYTAFFKKGVDNARINLLRTICENKKVSMYEMTGNTLDVLVGHHPHQGVCLDVSTLHVETISADDISSDRLYKANGEPEVWMLPYKVKDTMNMGAVLRSSHYFGVSRVLVPASSSSAMNAVVSKASAGAMEIMDIKTVRNETSLVQCLEKWKTIGGLVVGTTGNINHEKVVPLNQFYKDRPLLLIIGNEAEGIGEKLTNICDLLLSVQTYQNVQHVGEWFYQLDSLNVSVATGVLLHSIMNNQRGTG
ncbi:Ribose methyltransferase [Mactra antiquata]